MKEKEEKKKESRMYVSLTQFLPVRDNSSIHIDKGQLDIHFSNGLYLAFYNLDIAKKLAEEILFIIKEHKKKLKNFKEGKVNAI